MPPHPQLDKTTRLQLGDHVSVAVAVFGESYARERGANPWHTEAVRDEGYVIGRKGSKWLIEFDDGEFAFDRRAISFISRPRAAPERAVIAPVGRRSSSRIAMKKMKALMSRKNQSQIHQRVKTGALVRQIMRVVKSLW